MRYRIVSARMEVGYGLEPILPDGKVGSFQREAIPLMKAADYNAALQLVTNRIANVIATDAGVQLTDSQPRAPTQYAPTPSGGMSIGGIILLVIIVVIILVTPSTQSLVLAAVLPDIRRARWRI